MRRLGIALLLLLASTSTFAQDWRRGGPNRNPDRYGYRDNYFELTPLAGYRYGGTIYDENTVLFHRDLDVESGANFGLNLGIPINDSGMKLELLVDHQDTHLTTDSSGLFGSETRVSKFKVTYFQAGVLVPFARSRNMTPYFAVDAGVANLDTDIANASSANRFAASAAIGIKLPIADNIAVKIEERGFFANTGDYGNDRCGSCFDRNDTNLYQGETSLGVSFRF